MLESNYNFYQLLLNLPSFNLEGVEFYNKERVSLHQAAICFNPSVIIIEHGHLFRHGAIALNKLTNGRCDVTNHQSWPQNATNHVI